MSVKKIDLLYRWIRLSQSGVSLEQLLLDRKIHQAALYGYDIIAECILYELKETSIIIQAIIDKKGKEIFIDYPAYKPNESGNLNVDAVIMMPVDNYEVIKSDLRHYTSAKIISIEEVLYEL